MSIKFITRRSFNVALSTGLISASSNLWAQRGQGSGRKPSRAKPPRLKQGDVAGLIAPAAAVSEEAVELSRQNITALGLKLREGKHLLTSHGYLAAKDRQRADDINRMFADPEVKAIFAVRGGWGSARLLRYLDWDMIAANPKLLIGYSDVTALHLAIAARTGQPTIHGPNAANSWSERSSSSLKALAMAGGMPTFAPLQEPEILASPDYQRVRTIAPGKATGRLIGGNLTVLAALAGTRWMPDMTGAILFLEDVGEEQYRIDRMLTQLREAGLLQKLSGFIFGQCRRCRHRAPDYAGFSLSTILQQHMAPLGIPAFAGANIGHIYGQYCIPMGAKAEMDAQKGTIQILESIVT